MAKKEKPEIYVQRVGNRLVPEFAMDEEAIMRFPSGQRIRVDLRTGRSPSRLRLYWQILDKLVDATGCSPNSDALHDAIKLELGFGTPVRMPSGLTILVPRSVAFERMKEEDFIPYFNRAIEWIATNYGVTPEQLMNGGATYDKDTPDE